MLFKRMSVRFQLDAPSRDSIAINYARPRCKSKPSHEMKLADALTSRKIRHPTISQKAAHRPDVKAATIVAATMNLRSGSCCSLVYATKFQVE